MFESEEAIHLFVHFANKIPDLLREKKITNKDYALIIKI